MIRAGRKPRKTSMTSTTTAKVCATLDNAPLIDNPKGELQELLQAGAAEPPRYEIISVTGPDHNREFECVVYHNKKELGTGTGKSKKTAESAAALAALQSLRAE